MVLRLRPASSVRMLGLLSAFGTIAAAASATPATDWTARIEQPVAEPWREIWAGAEATRQAWSAYTGMTVALGASVRDEGWRLRSASGYGRYHYQGYKYVGGHPIALTTIQGTSHFTDVMLGYESRFDQLTVKAFAGINMEGHQLTPDDSLNAARGTAYGFKAALELWINLTDAAWLSLDQGYASAHDTYSARLRAGYRMTPRLSVGPEAGAIGTKEMQNGRAGGFLRYEWLGGEASTSAGLTGDIAHPATPYASVNLMLRY